MIKRYNNISLAFGVPGILLQIGGRVMEQGLAAGGTGMDLSQQSLMVAISFLAMLAGTALLLVGFAYYAKAKNRSPWWCLVAFLSCLGLILLACLKDRDDGRDEAERAYLASLSAEEPIVALSEDHIIPAPEEE